MTLDDFFIELARLRDTMNPHEGRWVVAGEEVYPYIRYKPNTVEEPRCCPVIAVARAKGFDKISPHMYRAGKFLGLSDEDTSLLVDAADQRLYTNYCPSRNETILALRERMLKAVGLFYPAREE